MAEPIGTRTPTNCFGDSYATITPSAYKWYTPKESNFVYTLIRRTLKTVENEVYNGAWGWS